MADFGRAIGIAFQIVDDVLDLQGDEGTTGKTLGTDLQQQKLTLPLIRALELAGNKEKRELTAILSDDRPPQRADLQPFLSQYQAVEYAAARAASYIDEAKSHLGQLPPSRCRELLSEIADFVLVRSK
jgi:octaprenyl-diphosphate synthase